MKTSKFFVAAVAAMGMVAGFSSCEKEGSDGNNGEAVVLEGGEISGRYSNDLTLKKGEYTLTGSLQMEAPATLTIEPGTTITSAAAGSNIIYILIEQGAKIIAEGTESEPITLTAEEKKAGAWGGLHICGYAHTNASGETTSEIGGALYGGSNDSDNSGVIKYVRIQYSGLALDSEHEANGLSLYGVGNGTEISYVQVLDGSDDGIEFFGGSRYRVLRRFCRYRSLHRGELHRRFFRLDRGLERYCRIYRGLSVCGRVRLPDGVRQQRRQQRCHSGSSSYCPLRYIRGKQQRGQCQRSPFP